MRKLLLVITSICIITMLQAQVSKTVNVTTAGTLSMLLTEHEDSTVTNLTVTGTIDSLDFITMHNMSVLSVLDLSGAKCTRIPNSAFHKSKLTSIIIPTSVTSIGNDAFTDCYLLTKITIPESVISIGIGAFFQCYGLTSITLPSTLTSIGESTFVLDSSLTSIIIPASVTSIGNDAFQCCLGLKSIAIPSSVTSIGYNALSGCISLASIILPSSITSIPVGAFEGCS